MAHAGRPLKFQDINELQRKISAYFQSCDEKKEPYTITGLALALDTSRETLMNYEAREAYFDTIKAAKLRCEHYAEVQAMKSNGAGAIFILKNYGWTDRQQIEMDDKREKKIIVSRDEKGDADDKLKVV